MPPSSVSQSAKVARQTKIAVWIVLSLVAILIAGVVAAAGFGLYYLRSVGKDPMEVVHAAMEGKPVQLRMGDKQVVFGKGDVTGVAQRLPNYPGATVQGSAAAMDEDKAGAILVLTTRDPGENVVEFYRQALLKADYAIVAADATRIKGASPDGNRTVTIHIVTKGAETTVTLTYADK